MRPFSLFVSPANSSAHRVSKNIRLKRFRVPPYSALLHPNPAMRREKVKCVQVRGASGERKKGKGLCETCMETKRGIEGCKTKETGRRLGGCEARQFGASLRTLVECRHPAAVM